MADVATLGLRIDSTGLITANKRLKDFEGAAVKAEDAAEDFGNAAQRAGDQTKAAGNKIDDTNKRLGRFGRSAGQAGIQIQQFVGQVQGGVSPMVALSQQATDLGFVLGFPLLGAVTGIAAALAGPLVSSLFEAGEEVETTAERLANLTKAMDDARESGERLAIFTNIQDITRIGEEIDTETKKLRELEDQLRRFEQMETIGNLVPLQTEIQQQRQIVDLLEADYDRLNQQGTILVQNFEDQAEAAKKSSRGMTDAEREALRLARAIEQQEKSAEGMIESFRSQTVAQQHGRAEAIRYTVAIEAAKLQNAELAARLVEAGNAYADTIKEQQKATKGFLELKAAFDPIVAVQAQYVASLKQIDDAGLGAAETAELQADALAKYNEQLEKTLQNQAANAPTVQSFWGAWRQGIEETAKTSEDGFDMMRDVGQQTVDSLAAGIAGFIATGEGSLRQFFANVVAMALEAQTKLVLTNWINAGGLGSIGKLLDFSSVGVPALNENATGGAYDSGTRYFASGGVPSLSSFSGSIVDKPTMFAAGGTTNNVMGEAGPEAILPLKRTPSGDLGVQTSGMGQAAAPQVNVPVKVINVSERPEDFLSSAAGEKLIVNIMSRNRRAFSG